MRKKTLFKLELSLLFKLKIVYLYIFLTLFYLFVLSKVPSGIRQTIGILLIFTDPAAMALFFMGAIMLLERSQNIRIALFSSPIKTEEYILSKAFSLGLIGTLV